MELIYYQTRDTNGDTMKESAKNITVFGGSNPKPGDHDYEQAYQLGLLLGSLRATVITGGYMGTMEAVSHGAVEAGGFTIGVTCNDIEKWRPIGANPWIQKEIRCSTLMQRISKLISISEAVIVLPGGIGTLAELSVLMNFIEIHLLPPRPVILIGSSWRSTFEHYCLRFKDYLSNDSRQWLHFSKDVNEVVKVIDRYFMKKA